ncbi:hypothetical protein [Streptomyces griseorubiginosus]|uniref:hypothetical protein n=1 Tax=Streptomyces griseorubiginosus TaxID=67304 RepID=UPI001AD7D0BD|nr:hypothetical protein [Streptomyces griseorubiginosus]MBO4257588.1 hypothetical protein [Streptomyces griseorubiginosus]
MTTQNDTGPTSAEEAEEPTRVLAPVDAHSATLHLGPAEGSAPDVESSSSDGEYSATVLASHWIQRPESDDTLVDRPSASVPSVRPDRVEGSVLRFGPGVTGVADRTGQTPPIASSPALAGRKLRRHALPVLVVAAVLALLAWQRFGQSLEATGVTVTARPTVLRCDNTADVVGLVTTNGRPGTLSYRWVRSDGTSSGVLHEVMVRGEKHARLHLRWTYQGRGHRTAQAELRILAPAARAATARFTYDCP